MQIADLGATSSPETGEHHIEDFDGSHAAGHVHCVTHYAAGREGIRNALWCWCHWAWIGIFCFVGSHHSLKRGAELLDVLVK